MRIQGKNLVHPKQWRQLAHLSPDDERSHVHGSRLCVDTRHREEQATDPPDLLPICETGAYLRTWNARGVLPRTCTATCHFICNSGKLEPTKCPLTMNRQIQCGLFTQWTAYNYVQQFGCSLIQKHADCGPIYRKVQKWVKLIYGIKNEDNAYPWRHDWKRAQGVSAVLLVLLPVLRHSFPAVLSLWYVVILPNYYLCVLHLYVMSQWKSSIFGLQLWRDGKLWLTSFN